MKLHWAQILKTGALIQLGFFFGLLMDPPIRRWYVDHNTLSLLNEEQSKEIQIKKAQPHEVDMAPVKPAGAATISSAADAGDQEKFLGYGADGASEQDLLHGVSTDGASDSNSNMVQNKKEAMQGLLNVEGSRIRDPSGRQVDLGSLRSQTRPDLDVLSVGMVYKVVHYIWCAKKVFEFQHYLSVRSVMRYIQPDRIIFHYAHYPRTDKYFYNMWFDDLKKEYPYIDLVDLGPDARACQNPTSKYEVVRELLNPDGGIFVQENTILSSFPVKFRSAKVINGLTSDMEGFLLAQRNTMPDVIENLIADLEVSCVDPSAFQISRTDHLCIIKKGTYYPRDSWNRTDDFSRLTKLLFYGVEEIAEPKASGGDLIPNIAHMMWLGGSEMNFLFFLSCLSLLHIVKVDKLYVHGNQPPSGEYWARISSNQKVVFVKRPWPNLIFRTQTKIWNHMSDILRGDLMIRYGGIYSDTDAIWVKPIPDHLRRFDAVATYDWPQMYPTYPDYVNFGISLGKPNAPFWQHFLQSMDDFRDDIYGYNGLLRPYKVFERHPELLYLYDHLQVMCWDLRCHPTWDPRFREEARDHRNLTTFNWREVHAVHWTYPDPPEFKDEATLRNSTGIWAEIGQHVLKSAGLI